MHSAARYKVRGTGCKARAQTQGHARAKSMCHVCAHSSLQLYPCSHPCRMPWGYLRGTSPHIYKPGRGRPPQPPETVWWILLAESGPGYLHLELEITPTQSRGTGILTLPPQTVSVPTPPHTSCQSSGSTSSASLGPASCGVAWPHSGTRSCSPRPQGAPGC